MAQLDEIDQLVCLQGHDDSRVRCAASAFLLYLKDREYKLTGATFLERGGDGYDPKEAERLITELRDALNA